MTRITRLLPALLFVGLLAPAIAPSIAVAEEGYKDITGTVTNSSGDPVRDAVIKLMKREGRDRDLKEIASTTSDKHGHFEFVKVAIGTFVVDGSKGDLHAMQHVNIANKGENEVTIKLHRGREKDDR